MYSKRDPLPVTKSAKIQKKLFVSFDKSTSGTENQPQKKEYAYSVSAIQAYAFPF